MTELREPQKVFDRANGQPIAILKHSALVGYYVPAEAVGKADTREATLEEMMDSLKRRRAINQPILDHLKDN